MRRVEKRIAEIEGLDVRVRHSRDGRDVRSDKPNVKQDPDVGAPKHSKNVKAWREGRFENPHPGYGVEVLDGEGRVAHGGLVTVRDGYLADE